MSFHEATVVCFYRHGFVLELGMDDVLVAGHKSRVALVVSPISSVMVDGELSTDISLMAANDGEILSLEMFENTLSVIIEWNDFAGKKSFTNAYKIIGENLSITVT